MHCCRRSSVSCLKRDAFEFVHAANSAHRLSDAATSDPLGLAGAGMSQTEFDICLVVETALATLADLEKSIGVGTSDGAHDKGTRHLIKSRGVWRTTVWQLCSGCPRTIPLEEQFAAIALRMAPAELRAEGILPVDASVYFSVGVFSDAQTPTVILTPRVMAIVARYGANLEMKFYAPDMNT